MAEGLDDFDEALAAVRDIVLAVIISTRTRKRNSKMLFSCQSNLISARAMGRRR